MVFIHQISSLTEQWPSFCENESRLTDIMIDLPLLEHPAIQSALDNFVQVLQNLCRVLFPDRVILIGPFVVNADLWTELRQRVRSAELIRGYQHPE